MSIRPHRSHTIAGLVLCGGRSQRMLTPKHLLPFGPEGETLLSHTVKKVAAACNPVHVIAAPGQPLPALPREIRIVRDQDQDQGPLAALAYGLESLPANCEAVFLCSCDLPFMTPRFISQLATYLEPDSEVVLPCDARYPHPLAAIYRPSVLPAVLALLKQKKRSLRQLLRQVRTTEITGSALEEFAPGGQPLLNVNSPADYQMALRLFENPAS